KIPADQAEMIAKYLPKEAEAEAPKETKPLTPEQQKAAGEVAKELWYKSANPFVRLNLEDVQQALYGKSEAEIKAIQAALKGYGKDLEEMLREDLDGAELGKALELLRHKDKDSVALPEGVDRAAVVKDADKIHDQLGKAGASGEIAKELAAMKPEQIQALVAL